MNTTLEITQELKGLYIFAGMPDGQLETVINATKEINLKAGDRLFDQGQPANAFYLVRSGLVKLFRLSPDGDEKIIELMKPGHTFAEATMFMGKSSSYPVNADAVNDSRLYSFDRKKFIDVLSQSTETCFGLMASMSRRLHMLVNQIDSLTLQSATYRMVAYLLELMPKDVHKFPEVQLTTPKGDIASRLSIQPETLSRILAQLRQQGLIKVHGNHVVVRDIQALRDIVHMPPADSG